MTALRRVKAWLASLPPEAVAVGVDPLSVADLREVVRRLERAEHLAQQYGRALDELPVSPDAVERAAIACNLTKKTVREVVAALAPKHTKGKRK